MTPGIAGTDTDHCSVDLGLYSVYNEDFPTLTELSLALLVQLFSDMSPSKTVELLHRYSIIHTHTQSN